MSKKRLTRCWTKGKKVYPGIFGTKDFCAWVLTSYGVIKLTKDEIKKLDLRNASSEQLQRITMEEASEVLEKKGYKWRPLYE
jgi:hypothetical protein